MYKLKALHGLRKRGFIMLKAVIFDMDGVLIDSEPIHARAAMSAMKMNGVDISYDYCMKFAGSTAKFMIESFIKDYDLNISNEELLKLNDECINDILKEEDYPIIPYVTNLIKNLYENNIKIAIASSSPIDRIESIIDKLNIRQYISVYVSGEETGSPKPAPDIFLVTAEKLNVDPYDCVVIEDSYNGITAAARAKMTRIGFLNTNSGIQDLSSVNFVIEGFEEINTKFIEKIYKRSKGQPVTIAETDRLIIRELTVDDIKEMYIIYQSPEIRQFVHDIDDYLNVEIDKHKAYIKNVYSFYGYGLWGIFNKSDNKLIGRCGIQNNEINGNVEIELGYLLDVKYWGFGYAIECTMAVLDYAFNELSIPRVVAVIDKVNYRSRKVADNIGFKIEKTINHNGRECYLYAIGNECELYKNN